MLSEVIRAYAPPTHRNRKYDFFVSGEVSDVAVERNSLLCCSSLTDGQRHAQNGVSTKLSCRQTGEREGETGQRETDRSEKETDRS